MLVSYLARYSDITIINFSTIQPLHVDMMNCIQAIMFRCIQVEQVRNN